jgi:hypothetical protein
MVWIEVPETVYDSVQNDPIFEKVKVLTRGIVDKHFFKEYGVLFIDESDYRAIIIDRDKYAYCLLKHAGAK